MSMGSSQSLVERTTLKFAFHPCDRCYYYDNAKGSCRAPGVARGSTEESEKARVKQAESANERYLALSCKFRVLHYPDVCSRFRSDLRFAISWSEFKRAMTLVKQLPLLFDS